MNQKLKTTYSGTLVCMATDGLQGTYKRGDFHATAKGVRAVFTDILDGQKYEMIVNPIFEEVE